MDAETKGRGETAGFAFLKGRGCADGEELTLRRAKVRDWVVLNRGRERARLVRAILSSFLPFFTDHRQLALTTFKGQLTLTTSKTLASRPVAELPKRKRFRRVRMRGGKREGLGAVKGALLPRLGSNQIR